MGRAITAAPRDAVAARLRRAGSVYAEDEADVLLAAAAEGRDLDEMVDQRTGGMPLELVVGWAEFCGLRVVVEPEVFIPRRRSEFLAETAVAATPTGAIVVDLCCGTGALGLVIATRAAPAEVHAADVSSTAVRCVRRNLGRVGGEVHQGDLYDALPSRLEHHVDVIVVNAPYVPTADLHLMPAEARDHEPSVALDGGIDGVAVHRRIAAGAPQWLSSRGVLLIETSDRQAPLTADAMAEAGLRVQLLQDEVREATVVVGLSRDATFRQPSSSGRR